MGHGRRCARFPYLPFREQAFKDFGFDELFDEPININFVGNHYLTGAHTHKHIDSAPDGYMHVRVNWMIQKPPVGGDPVFDDGVVSVLPGDVWICFASEEHHSSTPIDGGERLICSFGALIKRPDGFSVKGFFHE